MKGMSSGTHHVLSLARVGHASAVDEVGHASASDAKSMMLKDDWMHAQIPNTELTSRSDSETRAAVSNAAAQCLAVAESRWTLDADTFILRYADMSLALHWTPVQVKVLRVVLEHSRVEAHRRR